MEIRSKVEYLGVMWDCEERCGYLDPKSGAYSANTVVRDLTFSVGAFKLYFRATNLLKGDVFGFAMYEGGEPWFDVWNISVKGIEAFTRLAERLDKLENKDARV